MEINQSNYYQDREHLTNSMLGWLKESPAYFKSQIDKQSAATDAMIFGTAFHSYVLEPDKFKSQYYVLPKIDRRTKKGKEEYAEHLKNAGDCVIINTDQYNKILGMGESIANNKTLNDLLSLSNSKMESVNVWEEKVRDDNDETHIIKCKSLIDMIKQDDDLVVDLKTTSSVKSFTSSIRKFGYDRQAAYYLRGLQANNIVSPEARFLFVAVEKDDPYEIAMFELDQSIMDVANSEIDDLLRLYQKCIVNNFYPKRYEQFDGSLNLVSLSAEDIYK